MLAGVWLGPWAIPLVLGCMLILQLVREKLGYLALSTAIIAVVIGALRGDSATRNDAPVDIHLSNGATGEVITMPKSSPGGVRVELHVSTLSYEHGSSVPVSFDALVRLPRRADVASGDRVTVRWSVEPLDRLPPGFARYVASRGATASASAWDLTVEDRGPAVLRFLTEIQERLTEGLKTVIPGNAGSLAAGIVTGNDAALSETARDAFLRTGTTHITAVSGSNIAMVLALWHMIVHSTRTKRVLIVQVAIVITIWLYAVIAGLEPSAVRAAIVASLGVFSGRFGRRADPLTILMLTTGGMALWNPNYTQMIGFWLSVVASFAIVSRIPASGRVTVRSAILGIAQGVLLAQAATLPLVMLTFGTWSLSSILANLVIHPVMTLAFPITFFLAVIVLAVPVLAPVIAWIPAIPLEFVLAFVSWLSPLASPIQIEPEGATALIGIGVPCGLMVIVASRDTERWARMLGKRWVMLTQAVTLLVLVPAIGAALGPLSPMPA